jgi:hypothetical protein
MSGRLLDQRRRRTILIGLTGILLSMPAIGQELQPAIVTGVNLYKNPYSYEKKSLWFDPRPVPFVYNDRVMSYSQPSTNALAVGFSGVSFNRALDARRLLFDLREQNYATSSSNLETYGQLAVVVREPQQMPLRLDRIWVLKGLGTIEGTNGFGAPITVPLVEFLYYRGDEPASPRLESAKQTRPPQRLPLDVPAATKATPGCMSLNTNTDFRGRVVVHEDFRTWTALKLERPLCIADSGSSLEEIQILDNSGGAVFQSLHNATVKVTGTLVSGDASPYYMTFFAIEVKSVHTAAGNTIVPVTAKRQPIPRELTSYHVRISTVVNPNHIIKAAWSESGKQLEPVSAYVSVFLNGAGDLAHLGCAGGFVISEIGSNLSSDERQEALKYNDLPLFLGDPPTPAAVDFTCRRE